jgi:phosphate transport system substrate-binding protein
VLKAPVYSKWFDEYAKVDPSVRFNYQSIGSGGGQKQILAQTVDFGASDGPMSDENLGKAPGKILHIPTVAGAVVRITADWRQRRWVSPCISRWR